MPERVEDRKLNPQIVDIYVGKRNLREISIYPLSLGDQRKLTGIISEAINSFFSMHSGEINDIDPQFIAFCLGLIDKNIENLSEMITDEGVEILDEITNDQLSKIIEIVYTQNYDKPVKNVLRLFEKSQKSVSERPSQPSVSPTATGSPTSTRRVSRKED